MPLPPLSSTSPRDWRYIAEGGANLVLAFSGHSDSPYNGRALRLRKRKKLTREGKGHDEVPKEVEGDFGRTVVEPLLGREQLPEMEKVELEREWVEQLVERLREERVRPFEREEEDEVDVEAKEAVVVEDLLSGEGVLAVEIKPKWGFLPSPTHLSPTTKPLKTSFCRFCMHRYYKRRGNSPLPSDQLASCLDEHNRGYCPLDLYSGDEQRIRRAVEALLQGWDSSAGEWNNLRVFLDGKRVSPQDSSVLAKLEPLLASLSPGPSSLPQPLSNPSSSSYAFASSFVFALLPTLLASPLLPSLQRLQSSLDPLDIEGLAALIVEELGVDITSRGLDTSALGCQPSMEEWSRWAEQDLPSLLSPSLDPPNSDAASPSTANPRAVVLAYLLSASFKDCSIIVRLPLLSSANSSSFSPLPPGPTGTVKAIDLDPKPINRLGKYWRMDQEIVKSWGEMLDSLGEDERAKVRRCRVE